VERDEAALLSEVVAGSQQAWQRFVKKHGPALRDTVRESTEAIQPLTPAQLDDVMGDFWLRMVDNDRRWLRRFRGRGASLEAFLRMHALDVAHEHIKRLQDEPMKVPLDEAHHVPAPRSTGPHDLASLASLLQLPTEVQALRADVNNLRGRWSSCVARCPRPAQRCRCRQGVERLDRDDSANDPSRNTRPPRPRWPVDASRSHANAGAEHQCRRWRPRLGSCPQWVTQPAGLF
jgi:DNA-directed RNA polymerase specialized sigma24 family protein